MTKVHLLQSDDWEPQSSYRDGTFQFIRCQESPSFARNRGQRILCDGYDSSLKMRGLLVLGDVLFKASSLVRKYIDEHNDWEEQLNT
jgi:hypothetical protein